MDDDAELVRRALARDQQAFAALYDRYADKLYDYARRQTGNAADAGDIVQDTFVLAIQRLHQLRDPSLVRPWLYAIARSEVHRRHRRVNKLQFTEPDEQAAMRSGEPTAEDLVHQQELRALFVEAANGLDPSDREVLDLHLRHSMTGAEIAATLGIPERQVGVVVQRVRERLGRSIGVVLLATTPKCPDLIELQRSEGSPLTVLSRKRLSRHIEGCLTCSQQLSDRMRPETLLAALPIALAPAFLRNGVLQRMAEAANLAPTSSGGSAHHAPTNAQPHGSGPPTTPTTPTTPSQPDQSARTMPQREGGRVWQSTDGFPRIVQPGRRFALIIGSVAAVALLLIFGVLIVNGGDSNKRITAGNTTLANQAVAADATTVVSTATPTVTAEPATTLTAVLPTTPVVTAPLTNPPPTNPPATNPPATTIAPDVDAPIFQSASASPTDISADHNPGFGATCPAYPVTSVITANVTDDRRVASVSVKYNAGGVQYNANLTENGSIWQVTIGPFPTEQFAEGDYPINAQFTATDAAGNSRVTNINGIVVLHDCIIIT